MEDEDAYSQRIKKEMLAEARRIFWESCVVSLIPFYEASGAPITKTVDTADKLTAEWDVRFDK